MGDNSKILMMVLSSAMAVFTGITAQLSFKVGIIPYTMQNLGVVLSGLLLGPYWGFVSQLVYLGLIAVGINFASGFTGGIGIFFGPTAGYLITFPLASLITGFVRRRFWDNSKKGYIKVWIGTVVAFLPVYAGGFLVFYSYATAHQSAMNFAINATSFIGGIDPFLAVLMATTVIYMPQDFLVDHILAIGAYKYIRELIEEKGIKLE
jgi:biotin transport system substrate-specific component